MIKLFGVPSNNFISFKNVYYTILEEYHAWFLIRIRKSSLKFPTTNVSLYLDDVIPNTSLKRNVQMVPTVVCISDCVSDFPEEFMLDSDKEYSTEQAIRGCFRGNAGTNRMM